MPDDRSGSTTLRVVVAFVVVYIVWGSTYLAIRVGVESIPPFLMGGLRFLASSAIMLALVTLRKGGFSISRTDAFYASLVGVLLFVGGNGLVNYAEQTVPSGLTALIVAIVPLWIAGFETVTRSSERLGVRGVIGIILGFAGVAVLVAPDLLAGEYGAAFGEVVLLVATLSWAAGSLLGHRHKFHTDLLLLSAVQMLAGGIGMTAIALVQNTFRAEIFAAVTLRSWLAFTYLVLFGSCLAFTAYVYLLQNVPASRVATYAYVNPVVAVLLGALILNEHVTVWILAGMSIILVALLMIRKR